MKNTFADKAVDFYLNLKPPENLPDKVFVMNPYSDEEVKKIVTFFYKKFFDDNNKRIFIFGINPGRFGGGVTGIPFTDPIAVENELLIKNNLIKKTELSGSFIYDFIKKFGSINEFYSKYFVSALFPLALIKENKNYNYYDDKKLFINLKPFIISSVKRQIEFGADDRVAYSLGKKNLSYLTEINKELKYFKKLKFLEHPRYIMQYKRKSINYYISRYLDELS